MTTLNVAKIIGGAFFIADITIKAAMSWQDPAFALPPAWKFALFVGSAAVGAGLFLFPRPGERRRIPDLPPRG